MKVFLMFQLFLFSVFYIYAVDNISPLNIEPGKYHILAYPINVRNQPNLNGRVIGQLQLHDEIEVIENMGNAQWIDDVFQNWYRIKFSNIEGYIWGGFIAIETFVFDIDNNGIPDFLHYRIAYQDDYWREEVRSIFFPRDIFIYINNERLITTAFSNLKTGWDGYTQNITYFRGGMSLEVANNQLMIMMYAPASNPVGGVGIWITMDSNGNVISVSMAL